MELPRRERGDELLRPGALTSIRARLRLVAAKHDLVTVIACAFDHRTRMLPFIYADTRMAPAGVAVDRIGDGRFRLREDAHRPSAVESAISGLRTCRSMAAFPTCSWYRAWACTPTNAWSMIRDARRIDPRASPADHRRRAACGLSAVRFVQRRSEGPDRPGCRRHRRRIRSAKPARSGAVNSRRPASRCVRHLFERATAALLDEIPGLVYARGDHQRLPEELVDTGIQRLLGDLDELPDSVLGYRLLEPPSRRSTLGSQAVPAEQRSQTQPDQLGRAYLRVQVRLPVLPDPCLQPAATSPEKPRPNRRRALDRLNKKYGLKYFFGADDNFFNNKARTLDIVADPGSCQF